MTNENMTTPCRVKRHDTLIYALHLSQTKSDYAFFLAVRKTEVKFLLWMNYGA